MKLAVILPTSRHGVLTTMAHNLAAAFTGTGHEVLLLDAAGDVAPVRRAVADGVSAVVSFGSFGAELRRDDGRSLYDAGGCVFVGWDVDHPVFQYDRFAAPLVRRIAVCASERNLEAGRRLGRMGEDLVSLPGTVTRPERPVPLHGRPYDLAVALSWNGAPDAFWRNARGVPAADLMEAFVERLFADPAADVLAAFEAARTALGLEIRLDAAVCNLLARGVTFVRWTENIRLVEALARTDRPILLLGSGWRGRLEGARRVEVREDAPFADVERAYAGAKVVANLNALNGASERALGALTAGALVASDPAPALFSAFEDAKALTPFDRRRPASLLEALDAVLAESDAQDRADAAWLEVAERHRWADRAVRLAAAVADLSAGARPGG